MSQKGSDPYCCCTGCQQRPVNYNLPTIHDPNVDPLVYQLNCCGCLPYFACIAVIDSYGNRGYAPFKIFCSTTPIYLGLDQPLYLPTVNNGVIEVGGALIDIHVYFFVNNGQCTIALRSTALGITENSYGASRVVDANVRAGGFCSTLGMDGLLYTSFHINGSNGISYEVRIAADQDTPINGRPQCVDNLGNYIVDNDPIKNLCCNCDCICTCMCLTVNKPNYGWSGTACLYNASWKFGNGMTVGIGTVDLLDRAYMIACWSMDEASGVNRIDTISNNNLEDSFGTPNTAVAIIGKAANFNGVSKLSSDSPSLSLSGIGFTVGLWVNFQDLTGTKGNQTIIAKTSGDGLDGFSWKIWYDNSAHRITFSASDGTAIHDVRADVLGLPIFNRYYFVSAKMDTIAKTMSIRVNAGNHDTIPFTGKIPLTYGSFCAGGQDGASPEYLWGYLDQVTIMLNDPSYEWEDDLYNNGAGQSCNANDQCYLKLLNSGDITFTDPPGPVLIDKMLNPCPRPQAGWAGIENATSDINYAHEVIITMSCASCSPTCQVRLSSCCPSGRTQFPKLLYCHIQNTCTTCPSIDTVLSWSALDSAWEGSANICGRNYTLVISCPFKTLGINDGLCISGSAQTDSSATCDPIYGTWTFNTASAGSVCCPGELTPPCGSCVFGSYADGFGNFHWNTTPISVGCTNGGTCNVAALATADVPTGLGQTLSVPCLCVSGNSQTYTITIHE